MSDQSECSRPVTVDRIEGAMAVIVDEQHQVELPVDWLPSDSGEGTLLILTLKHSPTDEAALVDRIKALQSRFRKPS